MSDDSTKILKEFYRALEPMAWRPHWASRCEELPNVELLHELRRSIEFEEGGRLLLVAGPQESGRSTVLAQLRDILEPPPWGLGEGPVERLEPTHRPFTVFPTPLDGMSLTMAAKLATAVELSGYLGRGHGEPSDGTSSLSIWYQNLGKHGVGGDLARCIEEYEYPIAAQATLENLRNLDNAEALIDAVVSDLTTIIGEQSDTGDVLPVVLFVASMAEFSPGGAATSPATVVAVLDWFSQLAEDSGFNVIAPCPASWVPHTHHLHPAIRVFHLTVPSVRSFSGEPREDVVAKLLRLLALRGDLDVLFGGSHLPAMLVQVAGGHLGTLLRLAQRAAMLHDGPLPITADTVQRAVDRHRIDILTKLSSETRTAIEWLPRTMRSLPSTDPDLIYSLIDQAYILPRANGEIWYEVLPLLDNIHTPTQQPDKAKQSNTNADVAPPTPPRLKLTRLELTNFRLFEHISLDLSPESTLPGQWQCIAGVNGSGKTALLQAICLAVLGDERAPEWGLGNLTRLRRLRDGARLPSEVRLHGHVDGEPVTWLLLLDEKGVSRELRQRPEYNQYQELRDRADKALFVCYGASRNLGDVGPSPNDANSVHFQQCATLFEPFAPLRFAEAILDDLPLSNSAFTLLDAILREVFADYGLHAENTPKGLRFRVKGGLHSAVDLPDGFRASVAWLADLCLRWDELTAGSMPDPRSVYGVVLVDELDLYLHPRLQRELIPGLRRTLPGLQWIVTTHSPLLLSSFDKDELVLLDSSEPDGVRHIDRQILGFTMDQIYSYLMDTEPSGREFEEAARRAVSGEDSEERVALLLEQSEEVDEAEAERRLARERELLAWLEKKAGEE